MRAVELVTQWRVMWFEPDDCGLVAINLVSVADNVVSRPRMESLNVVEKSRRLQFERWMIAVYYCHAI
jgi:hypothetical protein